MCANGSMTWKGFMGEAHSRYELCLLGVQSANGAMYPDHRIEKP